MKHWQFKVNHPHPAAAGAEHLAWRLPQIHRILPIVDEFPPQKQLEVAFFIGSDDVEAAPLA